MKREHYFIWFLYQRMNQCAGIFSFIVYYSYQRTEEQNIIARVYWLVQIESNKNLDFAKKLGINKNNGKYLKN
jgi:hypothetical protein